MDWDTAPFVTRVGLPAMEARRHYDQGHAEHLRLALILLDGAAEVLLRRSVDDAQWWFQLGDRSNELNREASVNGEPQRLLVHLMTFPSAAVLDSAENPMPVYLSKGQRKRLDREFDPNVDVAMYFHHISKPEAQALKHLHEYRNAAYWLCQPNPDPPGQSNPDPSQPGLTLEANNSALENSSHCCPNGLWLTDDQSVEGDCLKLCLGLD